MPQIRVWQYMQPDGRQKPIVLEVSKEAADASHKITGAGYRFTCEVLNTGEVALYISDDQAEEDLDCRIATNGPGKNSPRNVLSKMILEFHPPEVKP